MATIFIVEDDPSLQLLFEKVLVSAGFRVIGIASNGEEAISMYKAFLEKPKVILMDHRMPIKTGLDAAIEILKMNYDTKIIFTTGDKSIKEKAISIGAAEFMEKPFTISHLIDKIKEVLDNT